MPSAGLLQFRQTKLAAVLLPRERPVITTSLENSAQRSDNEETERPISTYNKLPQQSDPEQGQSRAG